MRVEALSTLLPPGNEYRVRQGDSEERKAFPRLEGSWGEEGCVWGAAGIGGVASETQGTQDGL